MESIFQLLFQLLSKADMNSDILPQMAANFFSFEPLSKTGYLLGVYHGWFHLKGLTRAEKNASRATITKWKILTHFGIRTRDLPLTKRTRYHWAARDDVCRVDRSSLGLTCATFRNLPVTRCKCSQIICVFCHLIKVSGATARWPFTDSAVPSSLLLFLSLF